MRAKSSKNAIIMTRLPRAECGAAQSGTLINPVETPQDAMAGQSAPSLVVVVVVEA